MCVCVCVCVCVCARPMCDGSRVMYTFCYGDVLYLASVCSCLKMFYGIQISDRNITRTVYLVKH